MATPHEDRLVSRLLIRSTVFSVVMACLLFWAAGTWLWPAAWLFMFEVYALNLVIGFWLAKNDPELLKQRLLPPVQKSQEPWDRILMALGMVLTFGWFFLIASDAGRGHRLHGFAWYQAVGAVGVLAVFYVVYLVFRENTFAAPIVRVQDERKHTVIESGPYRFVRHPMYSGTLLFFISVPLLLRSWLGLACLPVAFAFFAVRAVMEEETLKKKLSGYDDYAAKVRYRLIPKIW